MFRRNKKRSSNKEESSDDDGAVTPTTARGIRSSFSNLTPRASSETPSAITTTLNGQTTKGPPVATAVTTTSLYPSLDGGRTIPVQSTSTLPHSNNNNTTPSQLYPNIQEDDSEDFAQPLSILHTTATTAMSNTNPPNRAVASAVNATVGSSRNRSSLLSDDEEDEDDQVNDAAADPGSWQPRSRMTNRTTVPLSTTTRSSPVVPRSRGNNNTSSDRTDFLRPREPSAFVYPVLSAGSANSSNNNNNNTTASTRHKPPPPAPATTSSPVPANSQFSFGKPSKRSVSLEDETPGPTGAQTQTTSSPLDGDGENGSNTGRSIAHMTAAIAAATSSSSMQSTTSSLGMRSAAAAALTPRNNSSSNSSTIGIGQPVVANRPLRGPLASTAQTATRRALIDEDDDEEEDNDHNHTATGPAVAAAATTSLDENPTQSNHRDLVEDSDHDSEDSDLQRALKESEVMAQERQQQSTPLNGNQDDPESMTDDKRETIRSNAGTLRSVITDHQVDSSLTDFLIQQCAQDQELLSHMIQQQAARADSEKGLQQLNELIQLNETVLTVLDMAKEHTKDRPGSSGSASLASGIAHLEAGEEGAGPPEQTHNLAQVSSSMEIGSLVKKKDTFSLICMLRSQNADQRLEAAMALMRFARSEDGGRLRDEIHSTGGLHSLLTLFLRSNSTSVKLIASLAVAYVLPASVVASAHNIKPQVGLKLLECLRFLRGVRQSTYIIKEERITRQECARASAVGLTTFWIHNLEPMLRAQLQPLLAQSDVASDDSPVLPPPILGLQTSSAGSSVMGSARQRKNRTWANQRREAASVQELLEMAIALVIQFAEHGQDDDDSSDTVLLVEAVCAVEVARPIAVREGILRVLVSWIKHAVHQKKRPAAVSSLRQLTSIQDKYMAGWIHSQMVSSGALPAIVDLTRDLHLAYPVRLDIAQILSSLCIAPHTRAAVVEADCINFLIDLLYEHATSEELALFAGEALLQLAAGAMQRAGSIGSNDKELLAFSSRARHDRILNDIVARGAIATFVAIALERQGRLRMIAIETLGVLSEDISTNRGTRLQLCEDGAARALGETMTDCLPRVFQNTRDKEYFEQLYQALCAMSNILDPTYEGTTLSRNVSGPDPSLDMPRPRSLLIGSCLQAIESGGLNSMLQLASFSMEQSRFLQLVEEACHSLALLSPFLLSTDIAARGLSCWADQLLKVFCSIVDSLCEDNEFDDLGDSMDLHVSLLQGIGALAKSAPLRVRVVDRILPYLVRAKNSRDNTSVSNSASHAFQSLEFSEDEVAVQTAGNNANLLCDWFCMQRSLLIQAMARAEIRDFVVETWDEAVAQVHEPGLTHLVRKVSERSRSEMSHRSNATELLFGGDDGADSEVQSIIDDYENMFGEKASRALTKIVPVKTSSGEDKSAGSLLSQQMYPLDSTESETDWILKHARAQREDTFGSSGLSTHVQRLLDTCFPSKLLRDREIPTKVIRLDASYNFRAILMPQRRYFSFRREGLILSRLCDKESAGSDQSDVHWTLNFTNSSFAGEFSESLVQALYMCPAICGLSFVGKNQVVAEGELERTASVQSKLDRTSSMQSKPGEGGSLLANLVGSLPPWVSNLTFERVLDDTDMKLLVSILETLGKLTGGRGLLTQSFVAKRASSSGALSPEADIQAQGRFSFFAVRHSPELSSVAWKSFFNLIGEPQLGSRKSEKRPLSTLRSLDLSGNGLGDDLCGTLLEIIYDKSSGCQIEELDLSGNRIGEGNRVLQVLASYVQNHQTRNMSPVKVRDSDWQPTLTTLVMSSNGLNRGKSWLEIIAMLKRDGLTLKSLDLSSNKLSLKEDDYDSDIIVSSLLKNTSLQSLDLSGNNFSPTKIDDILGQLRVSENKELALLHLSNNTPPLNDRQEEQLEGISRSSRYTLVKRLNAEKEAQKAGDLLSPVSEHEIFEKTIAEERPSDIDEAPERRISNQSREETLADNKITVLFSAPLVFKDATETLRPFAKLDFEMERELLWQCLKEASRDIELSFDSATHDRLLATISKRCSCLHYSGHGNEHYLPFEDGKGGPNWFEVEDIKKLIAAGQGGVPFRFVFVSACYSGLAGETFAAAGVPHVVCCRQEFELKDAAALAFTRQFYLALAVGHTVKESFELGCKAVRATPNLRDAEQEMEKFILLPRNGNHDVPIFDAKPVLQWPRSIHGSSTSKSGRQKKVAGNARFGELGVRNMIQEDPSPSPPQFFLGREVDMYIVLNLLMAKRLVSVVGDAGMGRSSLVCALCHYINERKTTMNHIKHIYYVKAKQGRSKQSKVRSLVQRLLKKLVEAEIVNSEDMDKDADIEALFDIVCKSLKNEKALIVFDRTDLLEDSDEVNEFPMLLSNLFRETRNVRVLLTGRDTLGIPSIGGHVEHYYRLGPLTFANSVKLFSSLCPYMHTPADRKRLFSKMVGDLEQAELLPTDPGITEKVRKQFGLIGNGVPSNIEKAAYTISKDVFMSFLRTDGPDRMD